MSRENPLKLISESTFAKEILWHSGPAFVEFYADWSGTSHILAPIVNYLCELYSGDMKFCRLNIDSNRVFAGKFGISTMPAILIFDAGQLRYAFRGQVSGEELISVVEQLLN